MCKRRCNHPTVQLSQHHATADLPSSQTRRPRIADCLVTTCGYTDRPSNTCCDACATAARAPGVTSHNIEVAAERHTELEDEVRSAKSATEASPREPKSTVVAESTFCNTNGGFDRTGSKWSLHQPVVAATNTYGRSLGATASRARSTALGRQGRPVREPARPRPAHSRHPCARQIQLRAQPCSIASRG
jgi:hypothetical protein